MVIPKDTHDSLCLGGAGHQPPTVHEPRQSLNGALIPPATGGMFWYNTIVAPCNEWHKRHDPFN